MSVIMLSVIMPSVTYQPFVPSVVMLNVVVPVFRLSVAAPNRYLKIVCKTFNPFS